MATQAHAIFCFETLAAQLENRKLPSLAEIEASWDAYTDASSSESLLSPTPDPTSARTGTTPVSDASTPSTTTLSSTSTPSSAHPSLLSKALHSSASSRPQPAAPTPPPPAEAPLFITWDTLSPRTHEHHLRGCIGTFAAQPLETGLRTYALAAALEDTRFGPVAPRELPRLACAVTLLTDFEACADAFDWTLGVHGLRISFRDARGGGAAGRRYSATYLPDVAVEQGWTQEETLVSLMRKGGWSGRREGWAAETRELVVTRYQGKKVGVEAAAWEGWRAWREGEEGEEGR